MMAEDLKAAGNILFSSGDYSSAAEKYTEAITLDSQNPVLFANRAACHNKLGRHRDGLLDAIKATELDPTYSKGWYRKGACEDGLGLYPESIESYQTASLTTSKLRDRTKCVASLDAVQAKISSPNFMSIDMMKALARAHDIPLPDSSDRDVIQRALSTHPLFGTEPKLRLLLIPESQTAPLTIHDLVRGPDIHQQIGNLLGCMHPTATLLYSEDQLAYVCTYILWSTILH
ncbi:hypothetical protein C8R43DRAFT_1046776 [Mycena crocata]|nr:hypothetical protein C8R43DRAFT_1046776 [Mycena crocata]